MKACGTSGELKVGYQRAAVLGTWTLEASKAHPMRFAVEAEVRETDSFWITQKPLTLILIFGRFRWQWYEVKVRLEDAQLTARVEGRPTLVKE